MIWFLGTSFFTKIGLSNDSVFFRNFIFKQFLFFQELFSVFSNRSYDSLDPRDQSFINDYENFKTRTFELDRKLGAVLVSYYHKSFLEVPNKML